jgi:ribulose bisphosphate carboxylase small subunit
MIEYIVNHTLYRKEEVINKIKSGQADLDELYLDIVGIQNKKERRGI